MYIVKYTGPFGFIKPWTAVRDSETFSQQFLTPSIVEGIEKKLFPELLKLNEKGIKKIRRHRIRYKQLTEQQEQIQPRGWNYINKTYIRPFAVLTRSVMLEPVLFLAFDNHEDAFSASEQHICLCRNEDILYPDKHIIKTNENTFNTHYDFSGFELILERNENSFLVGYNRFNDNEPMYGHIKIVGTPVPSIYEG